MPKIRLRQGENQLYIEAGSGRNLLQVIQSSGFKINAPCGGNGTCGKCMVKIHGEDFVSACTYIPERDLAVILPDSRESKVLTTQYMYSVKVPLLPGASALKATYPLGVAIDIGTTTVVFYLISLVTGSILHTRGVLNPQARFGADVISRILHCSKPDGLTELQTAIVRLINEETRHLVSKNGVSTDQITKITVAGNTTMLHLLLGIDPGSLALAPFTPVFTESKKMQCQDLGIQSHPDAELFLLPSIAAYVGSDIVAGLASISPPVSIRNYLFIDIGTNGELALVTPEKIYCCATAAGPAFEGASISCGMGAFPGAISAFKDKSDFVTISGEPPAGICGSGLVDIVAYLLKEKLISADGILENDFIISGPTKELKSVYLDQKDIREVQLAKAAIFAGLKILVKTAGLDFENLDAIFLAGGFGNYINMDSAVRIGMLPEEMLNKTITVGNSSGTGACLALKSRTFEKNMQNIVESTEYIELSIHEDFVLEYALGMNFPE